MKIIGRDIARVLLRITPGLLGVALITAVCFRIERLVIPALLYLLVVVLESLWGGFASAAVVSVVAATCMEYFLIPPVLQWQVDDPEDYLALVIYLVTSLVITRLASRARSEAQKAERRRRDVTLLYEAASRLLSLGPEMAAGPESLRIFQDVFGLQAACLFDEASARIQIAGDSRHNLPAKTRDACLAGSDYQAGEDNLYIRCLRSGHRITGAVGFEGQLDKAVALALSVLAATASERTRAFRSANKAAADAQAEMLRSAILDAFAHEFKTPLAIILAAAGGIRETTSEQIEQMEMTEIIENQTIRLSALTTRLLRMARLDRDEVEPAMEFTELHSFLAALVKGCESQFGRHISYAPSRAPIHVTADPELLSLALTQLIDNAGKYSLPDTPITLETGAENAHVDIRVINQGIPVRPEEQEAIFQRFFRGADIDQIAPGSGLGLYVARKIVRAHGGELELERSDPAAGVTIFRVRLPIVTQGAHHEQEADQSLGSRR